jgi:hypothetical protein
MKLRPYMIVIALASLAAAGLLLGAPAGAQEGEGLITLEAAHPAATSVHFIVRVTWEHGGRPAADAVVTAAATGSDGTQLTPVTLAPIDDDGRYANAIDFGSAGSWTVRFTSIHPTGTAEVTQAVEKGGAAASDDGEDGFAPANDDTGASGAPAGSDGGDSGMPIWLIVAAAVVAFGGGFMALRTMRRYRSEAAREEGQFAALETARTAANAPGAADGTAQGPKAEA